MKKIYLSGKSGAGKYALVDDKDYKYLNQFSWYLSHGYAFRRISDGIPQMHALINKTPKGLMTDHINGDKLDNRRSNLRAATRRLNRLNYKNLPASGFRGVRKTHKGESWDVRVTYKNEQIFIGTFKNILHAAIVYDLWIKDIHGDTMPTNF